MNAHANIWWKQQGEIKEKDLFFNLPVAVAKPWMENYFFRLCRQGLIFACTEFVTHKMVKIN